MDGYEKRAVEDLRREIQEVRRILAVALVAAALTAQAFGQTRTLAERLGYPRDAKLLIVHADDLGMARSINTATIKAFETGLVTSGSIMVPCPWFPDIAAYARAHPDADLGLHLTLTSEWTGFRWGPVLPRTRVPSLFDQSGYLYPTEDVAAARINPRHAEAEIRAQIERARAYGIRPTHLDSHMGTLYQNAKLFAALLRVAREQRIPARISKNHAAVPFIAEQLKPSDIVIDQVVSITDDIPAERWVEYYTDALKKLEPGVTEFVVHIAYDDEEMRGATWDHPDWGAAWRQRDYDFFTSDRFRQLVQENNIRLITWRELGKLQ
jgi:predicted glycoside hydrolase/deacetylase ChbG (UPF0249 family)